MRNYFYSDWPCAQKKKKMSDILALARDSRPSTPSHKRPRREESEEGEEGSPAPHGVAPRSSLDAMTFNRLRTEGYALYDQLDKIKKRLKIKVDAEADPKRKAHMQLALDNMIDPCPKCVKRKLKLKEKAMKKKEEDVQKIADLSPEDRKNVFVKAFKDAKLPHSLTNPSQITALRASGSWSLLLQEIARDLKVDHSQTNLQKKIAEEWMLE